METTTGQVTTPAADSSSYDGPGQGSSGGLSRRRSIVVAAALAAAAVALALDHHWLAVADLVPLLLVLPCAAMMFKCMKGMNPSQQTDTTQASAQNVTPTATDIRS